MKTYFVVTSVIKNKDKILILKKGADDRNYPNKWSFCSGFVKEFEAAEDTALREIKEETSLDARIIKKGDLITAVDENNREHPKTWVAAVFLCETDSSKVKLCNENSEYRLVTLNEVKDYDFVPALAKDLKSLGLQ